jgi:hypothetical protein
LQLQLRSLHVDLRDQAWNSIQHRSRRRSHGFQAYSIARGPSNCDRFVVPYSPRLIAHMSTVDGSGGQAGLNYRKPWKRILYEKQNYRDNYIDPVKFLDQLELQQNDLGTTFLSLFLSASVVAQQFTVVATFLTIYRYILIQKDILQLAGLDAALLVVGYGVTSLLDKTLDATFHATSVKTSLLFGLFLRISAPILRTLTSSFSEDTIHALAITFSTIHLVFHDYAYVNSKRECFSGTLSLNAALFTAIILASRLEDIELVVSFLLLAGMYHNNRHNYTPYTPYKH